MAVTIIDVAKKCGYSKATVSRAFISPETVRENTRNIIYATAKSLNYTPNTIARALVRRHTENIAFIINEKQYPAILNPFYAPVLESIIQEAYKRKYNVFIANDHDIRLPNGESYIRKHMDGVIFAGEINYTIVNDFLQQAIPVVLLNNAMDIDGLACVTSDHYGGAVLATEHLVERGHRKIGLLAGRFSAQVREARFNGYKSVLESCGIPIDEEFIVEVEPRTDAAEEVFAEMLKKGNRPTAFFCTNDSIAAGAVKAVLHAGLRVPEDMAIVGFDDSIISTTVEPELTTIRISTEDMGKLAIRKLFAMIDNEPLELYRETVPATLIIRRST